MYATVAQVAAGFRDLSPAEEAKCMALLEEAAVIIDVYNENASAEAKQLVSCFMVRRVLGDDSSIALPIGATQASVTAGPYSQSMTLGSGSGGSGELYLGRLDKRLLGLGNSIGSYSPVQEAICHD